MQPNAVISASAAASTMPGEVLSPSQAGTFLGCSAKYRFKYLLGLPDPTGGGGVRGKAVHKAVEYYMRAKIAGIVPDHEAIAMEWDGIWDAACDGAVFSARENVDALNESARKLTEKYLKEAAPSIDPVAVEVPVTGEIAGVKVRGIIDIVDAGGRIIDLKTRARKSSKVSGTDAFQLATYTALGGDGVSGETRLDLLVSTKDPQFVPLDHLPGAQGQKLVEIMYPLVAEGIANGLFIPNRASIFCSSCPYQGECEREYGGKVAADVEAA
jgi:RecB family exonuclease